MTRTSFFRLSTLFLALCLTLPLFSQKLVLFSKTSPGSSYEQFILHADPALVLKSAYGAPPDSVISWLNTAAGIVITGGEDVYPGIYGKEDELEKCGKIDHYRDSLEMAMINFAHTNKVPLLGICRGAQILNVTMGGSLVTDIPTDITDHVVHRNKKGAQHSITILPGSFFHSLENVEEAKVNSYHHQCADRIAPGFKVSATAADGVVEAIEPVSGDWRVLGVQFHPEKMDHNSNVSSSIGAWFVSVLE